MELNNDFEVDRPIGDAWEILTDVERIAPCMPGAQLTEIEGDEYRGKVKIKVGPITAEYKGAATFLEKDEVNHKAVLEAKGRDSRGQGNASAIITATLTPNGNKTKVNVHTDLTITGKVAQFGRGVIGDVSVKLLNQFVDCLETKVLAEDTVAKAEAAVAAAMPAEPSAAPAPASEEPAPAPATSGVRKIDMPEVEPMNLIGATGAPIMKRLLPALGVIFVLLVLSRLRRKG